MFLCKTNMYSLHYKITGKNNKNISILWKFLVMLIIKINLTHCQNCNKKSKYELFVSRKLN